MSWGHPIPAGEACAVTEAPKGNSSYYVLSDGGTHPCRAQPAHRPVSWGHPIPAGEACAVTEAPKGNSSYYVLSDGGTHPCRAQPGAAGAPVAPVCAFAPPPSPTSRPWRNRRTGPLLARGFMVSDLIAILGSLDYVLAEVDRAQPAHR